MTFLCCITSKVILCCITSKVITFPVSITGRQFSLFNCQGTLMQKALLLKYLSYLSSAPPKMDLIPIVFPIALQLCSVSLALKWPKLGAPLLTCLCVFLGPHFGFTKRTTCFFPALRTAWTQGTASINPPLLVFQTFHTDWSYFILSTMNPIRFPLFRNSPEAMLNCLLIRPLWHDHNCSVCTHTHTHAPTGAHIYMHAQGRAYKHSHTSIYTSNLLVMRSVLSLELREKREDMKERRKRDERRGEKQRKSHVMFSHWRSECAGVCMTVCVHSAYLHHLPIYVMYFSVFAAG